MLIIYTVVFSTIFHTTWADQPGGHPGRGYFAACLFAGLIPFNVFAETLSRAPTLILSVPNYVKKVVFPLEILPVVALGSAIIHSLVSVIILVIASLVLERSIPPWWHCCHWQFVPKLVLICLGMGWFLASLGTYMRDLAQGIIPVVQVMMFLTPIFYPVSTVPGPMRSMLAANPLTLVVQGFR